MGSIPATPSTKHASCFPPSSLPASIEISIKLIVCLNIYLVLLVWAEIELVYGSDFVLRAGFTSQCSGQGVIASCRFTVLFWHVAFYSFSMG
jgi:hypothetical protein